VKLILATKQKKETPKKKCLACPSENAEQSIRNFYISKNPMHQDGFLPWCKECVKRNSLNSNGEIDETKLKNVLQQVNKPYYKDILQSSINQFKKEHSFVLEEEIKTFGEKIIGLYFKNIQTLRQATAKSYEDSVKEGFINNPELRRKEFNVDMNISDKADTVEDNKHTLNIGDFEVTDEIKNLFGEGYSTNMYKKMHDKYEKLKINYSLQTNLHQESLATYVRFKVKEEEATAKGNVEEAKKWYDAAINAADKARLTPKQLTKADLQGGITSISEISRAVEQAVDIIEILPRFKFAPNDMADFIIWCYINYERDLHNLPQINYEDVYKFYDKKKQEYLSQYGDPYGIFTDEPDLEKMRPKVKQFITLPDDYDVPDGEDNE